MYLQRLIKELNVLWEEGVQIYDAYSRENFVLHVAVLWTISNFPAYAVLSGWPTKGQFAYPACNKETRCTSLKIKEVI